MAKQKNRLTTTRQVLAGERFAYPVPTIHPQKTGDDETRLPYTARISFRQCQIRRPENRPPDRPNLSCLPCTPLTLACTGADIKLNQDKPAYPRPHTSHIIDR